MDELHETLPTRMGALLFRAKALCFQARRLWQDTHRGGVARHSRAFDGEMLDVLGEWKSALRGEGSVPGERKLQLGKIQNLRVAAQALNGLNISAGETFSFWRQIGRPVTRRGFAVGRELREGCLIPTVGGGLCQLSGAIYNAAIASGLEVRERHAHSHSGVGTLAQMGRDATVFWNYVDLRLRSEKPWRLEVSLTRDQLVVRIRGAQRARQASAPEISSPIPVAAAAQPNSCMSCGVEDCFRHHPPSADCERTAVLVDEWWPEWQAYLDRGDFRSALLCRPLDGTRFRKPNYRWDASGFGKVTSATFTTLRRAWAMRSLREQGAARQEALLEWDQRLARALARKLRPEHTHLIVSQNLLPFLWRDGILGGRTFDVFMTRLPLAELHRELDRAATLHPESETCADFRAPHSLLDSESEALAAANRWITPHAHVAQLAGGRSLLLPWSVRAASRTKALEGPPRICFPATTLCRKGAYELREAARELDLEIVCTGGQLEGADFWSGLRVTQTNPEDWLRGVSAVALPAFFENRPRRLLQAIAAGVPVIASTACGLHDLPGVTEIESGDTGGLIEALRKVVTPACLV